MMSPQPPIKIADFFVCKGLETGKSVTPLKLIKLTYIAHGWHLALFDTALLTEQVQAWQYGPVIPSVYYAFSKYGKNSIRSPELYPPDTPLTEIIEEVRLYKLLSTVWDRYSDLSGIQLSSLTHQPNTPWDIIWHQKTGKNDRNAIIPNNLIQQYYKAKQNATAAG